MCAVLAVASFLVCSLGTAASGPTIAALAGFPIELKGAPSSGLAVIDLDGDKRPEVVATAGGRLVVINSEGQMRRGFPLSLDNVRVSEQTSLHLPPLTFSVAPSACDVDGDKRPELIVAGTNRHLYAVSAAGRVISGYPLLLDAEPKGQITCAPGADGEGVLYLTTTKGSVVRVAHAKATVITNVGEGTEGGVGLIDVNGDGVKDLIVSGGDGTVHIFDEHGTALLRTAYKTSYRSSGTLAFGDIDDDGELEIIFTCQDFRVHALKLDGQAELGFPFTTDYRIYAGVALADLNGDDVADIVVGSGDSRLYALTAGGVDLPGFPVTLDGRILADVAIGDLDRDGSPDIAVVTNSGSLYVVDAKGKIWDGFPVHIGGQVATSPAIADVDSDGWLELFAQNGEGAVFGYRVKAEGRAPRALAAWPMMGHDPGHLGRLTPNPVRFQELSYDNQAPTRTSTVRGSYRYVNLDGEAELDTQIRWKLDGKAMPALANHRTITPELTRKHQHWQYSVQEAGNFKAYGETGVLAQPHWAREIEIRNTPPDRPEIVLSPARTYANSTLSVTARSRDADGDELTYRYTWLKDGVAQREYLGAQGPRATLHKGERWQVVVTAFDGEAEGEGATASVVVENTPPEKPEVATRPAQPRATDNIDVVVVKPAADLDADTITYRYYWRVNNVPLNVADTTNALAAGALRKHDRVRVEVVAHDVESAGGHAVAEFEVQNTPPPAPVGRVLWPEGPHATDGLSARVVEQIPDADHDTITYRYAWFKNGHRTPHMAAVPAKETHKGETWRLSLTPFDGEAAGETVTSEVTIQNTPPSPPHVMMRRQHWHAGEPVEPIVTFRHEDEDGDAVHAEFQWIRNKAPYQLAKELRALPAGITRKGESWQVIVTANDGQANSDAVRRDFTIVNSPPSPPSIAISPAEPTTSDELHVAIVKDGTDADGDRLTYRYRWIRDGEPIEKLGTGRSALLAGEMHKGQLWRVEVASWDTEAESEAASVEFRVANHPPNTPRVSMFPASPTKSDPLVCHVDPKDADPDGDHVTYRTLWLLNGEPVPYSGDMDVLPVSLMHKGQSWQCEVTASDGLARSSPARSEAVKVHNTPPSEPKVRIEPSVVTIETEMRCVVEQPAIDADGDAVTYVYGWRRNDQPYLAKTSVKDSRDVVIAKGTARRGETWLCEVTASDGEAEGLPARVSVRVKNALPQAPEVSVRPDRPVSGDTLRCEIVRPAHDSDGDAITYQFAWFQNGKPQSFGPTSTDIPGRFVKAADAWKCAVTASDAEGPSPAATSTVATVGVAP